ncbi:MAG TPA: hypothetical protein VK971_09990 [Thiohalobacter sp.]|nr:hypothetical protein [Thiohalobacter sp.]
MHNHPVQLHRLLIIACLALVQLFAPLVHAHTGDSRQAGVHVHVPAAVSDSDNPTLTVDPGLEIGIESMRRESVGLAPAPDSPPLRAGLSETPSLPAAGMPPGTPASHPPGSYRPGIHPSRGPPGPPRIG